MRERERKKERKNVSVVKVLLCDVEDLSSITCPDTDFLGDPGQVT